MTSRRIIRKASERILSRRSGPENRVRARAYRDLHLRLDAECREAKARAKQERQAAREAAE